MEIKLLAGITEENELYFLEIEPKSEKHTYFSMSGFTVTPIRYDDAVERSRESLEDGELWRQAVEAEITDLGLNDWIEQVLGVDGETSQIDTSLLEKEVMVEGETWLFESGGCGQHEEAKLAHYFIDKKLFDELMKLWKKNHLKEVDVKLPELPKQNLDELLEKAIKIINE